MQWILQEFEDTRKLAQALDRLEIDYTFHNAVPFEGDLLPEPEIDDPDNVVLFGSYTLWRYALARGLKPGVFRLRPFVHEAAWQPYLLNGAESVFLRLDEIPDALSDDDQHWFMRPVEDSKVETGRVRKTCDIRDLALRVLCLDEADFPLGSLRHDTQLMLSEPVRIFKEWRCWVVGQQVITCSLYKEGMRVVYRREIDQDAHSFARHLADQTLITRRLM